MEYFDTTGTEELSGVDLLNDYAAHADRYIKEDCEGTSNTWTAGVRSVTQGIQFALFEASDAVTPAYTERVERGIEALHAKLQAFEQAHKKDEFKDAPEPDEAFKKAILNDIFALAPTQDELV